MIYGLMHVVLSLGLAHSTYEQKSFMRQMLVNCSNLYTAANLCFS